MQIKKILISASIAALMAPALAFAASNTVTLTTDVVLNIGGITVNVTGSSATISSIVVSGSTFAATVESGSYFKVSAPNGNALDESLSTAVTHNRVCNSTASTYEITANTTATVTITPQSETCATRVTNAQTTTSSGGGNGPIISSGGGGGGGGAYTPPPTPAIIPTTSGTAAQLQQQIQGLMGQIQTLSGGASFKRDLKMGMTGSDVKSLQAYLNAHGYVVTSSGGGSPGNETTKFGGLTKAALIKLQKAAGISPAAGYFGAKTRAYIAAHP
ncbi:peptidoglycan-binding protein [Candidatus Kaiserbacteria bacterium]|nr:peptidoglycan-binding protein [Candidatus Kaiserbacteria bacterium]